MDKKPTLRPTWMKVLAGAGALLVAFAVVLVRDVARIDPTSGGYEAPYDDFSGEPIDWSAHRLTDSGFRDDGGILLNTSLDCTTGQIRGHIGPFTVDYRKLSERAIVVHQPHVACLDAGFEPEWDHPAEDLALAATGSSTRG